MHNHDTYSLPFFARAVLIKWRVDLLHHAGAQSGAPLLVQITLTRVAFLEKGAHAMSVRPRQVAEEAHKFSLRHVFGTLEQAVDEEPPPPPAPIAAPVSPTTAPVGLHFDLNLPTKTAAPAPLLALPTNGLKFTLPQMRAPQSENGGLPVKSTAADAGGKMLRAGYIVGGAQGSQTEVLRLNGIVDDLQHKLKKCADRLATTEQSVARGNAALQSERATSHARMVALAGQVKQVQERETAVRAEMAAMPKVSDFDQQKFEMQAQGALQLEQKYEEEVARVAALEETLASLRVEHETVRMEHASLQAELEVTKAAVQLAETNAASIKREALEMVAEAEAKTDALITQQAKTAEEMATAAKAGTAQMEAVMMQLNEANSKLELTKATMETEIAKGVEADTVIKDLDAKLVGLRNEVAEGKATNLKLMATATDATQRCGEALLEAQRVREEATTAAPVAPVAPVATDDLAAPDDPIATTAMQDTIVKAFEKYCDLKKVAESSVGTPDAAHHHNLALRAYDALSSGTSDVPMVFSCCIDAPHMDEEAEHITTTAATARAALRDSVPMTRLSGTHRDLDCPIDLTTTGASTGTPTDTTPLALKMRTDEYVKAVSKDLRRGLTHASREWITAAGGELPPLPPDMAIHGPEVAPGPQPDVMPNPMPVPREE